MLHKILFHTLRELLGGRLSVSVLLSCGDQGFGRSASDILLGELLEGGTSRTANVHFREPHGGSDKEGNRDDEIGDTSGESAAK